MSDSTAGLGSLGPAAPICCRHSAGSGLSFCLLEQQLYFAFCHVTFLFPQLSEWERALHLACTRYGKLLLKHENVEHLTFQMTRPSEQAECCQGKKKSSNSKGYSTARPILSCWMCVHFHVWLLHVLIYRSGLLTWVPSRLLPMNFHLTVAAVGKTKNKSLFGQTEIYHLIKKELWIL